MQALAHGGEGVFQASLEEKRFCPSGGLKTDAVLALALPRMIETVPVSLPELRQIAEAEGLDLRGPQSLSHGRMSQCFKFTRPPSGMEVDFRNPRRKEVEETKHQAGAEAAAVVHAKKKIIRTYPRPFEPSS